MFSFVQYIKRYSRPYPKVATLHSNIIGFVIAMTINNNNNNNNNNKIIIMNIINIV
jgi:hypothetical protein